ncbi:hypothetical protein M1446_03045 [Candidatus Dependentiae bacterium]|nr:hypothetical protein [Candidatus Dependentiae bacterium]
MKKYFFLFCFFFNFLKSQDGYILSLVFLNKKKEEKNFKIIENLSAMYNVSWTKIDRLNWQLRFDNKYSYNSVLNCLIQSNLFEMRKSGNILYEIKKNFTLRRTL